ncbi:hypothetical protein SPRG_11886 [Saprolegnia parasitica CBS 223.65]|uniref:Uncharacterized protein n=1 Tax=Saprolegnia parasitica (strain CBS 223.65) TaxID=695850 RepID=A0A067BWX9_SAPPC|nr:hypothetical protein SPRG_11886 [Saprolegnia parasitica CBS 223.65]KDO23039.1 hypothetical protein SPRG_11886 [Saprolegnia parasitica CBS 223.65]|eukprot:XP_012206327.1 hypothetical protein SPRG_11886 [Saprolegnia parasitica CBS 223.65]
MHAVKATVDSHDHYNDYGVLRPGVQLWYGGSVGYGASGPQAAIQWERNSTDEVIYR